MAPVVVVQELDFHPRHIDAGRTLALAALAPDAQLHGFRHGVGDKGVRPKLAGDGEAERVGPPAGHVGLVPGDAEGRAHDVGVGFPAGAVVVAHLDGAGEAAPFGPVEHGLDGPGRIAGLVAEQAPVIHLRRPDDAARVEQSLRVEGVLDVFEGAHDAGPEHELVEFRANDAVAVFAGMGALVVADHGEGLFRDGPHFAHVAAGLHVEHRAHVQAADGGVRVPRAPGAVLLEDPVEALGVFAQVLERHRAVLDEGHRFAVPLHGHHDVEAGLADLPNGVPEGAVGDRHHGVGEAEGGHEIGQLVQTALLLGFLVAGELDQEKRFACVVDQPLYGRPEGRNIARQVDHGAVHHLHRRRLEPDDVTGRLHGLGEGGKPADTEDRMGRDRL